MDIGDLLAFAVGNGASDLHLSAGLPPMVRVDGDLRRIEAPVLGHAAVRELVCGVMNDAQRKDYEERLETDFSCEVSGLARFRVNAFTQHRGAGAVFRVQKQARELDTIDISPGQTLHASWRAEDTYVLPA